MEYHPNMRLFLLLILVVFSIHAKADFYQSISFEHVDGYDGDKTPVSNLIKIDLGVRTRSLIFFETEFGVNGEELVFDDSYQRPQQYEVLINFLMGAQGKLSDKIYIKGYGGLHAAFFDKANCIYEWDGSRYVCENDVDHGGVVGVGVNYKSYSNGSFGLAYNRYFLNDYPTFE